MAADPGEIGPRLTPGANYGELGRVLDIQVRQESSRNLSALSVRKRTQAITVIH